MAKQYSVSVSIDPVAWQTKPYHRTAWLDGLIRSARLRGATGVIKIVEPTLEDFDNMGTVLTAVWENSS